MTDLSDFVEQALVAIVNGVKSAAEQVEELGGVVNPTVWEDNPSDQDYPKRILIAKLQQVEFDIAVTSSGKKSAKGGGGFSVGVVSVAGGGDSVSENSKVSRIKFSVPVGLPYHKQPERLRHR